MQKDVGRCAVIDRNGTKFAGFFPVVNCAIMPKILEYFVVSNGDIFLLLFPISSHKLSDNNLQQTVIHTIHKVIHRCETVAVQGFEHFPQSYQQAGNEVCVL